MPRNSLLKTSRLIHLYFGVFITPALIFFAFTGAIQTFGLHETNRDHPNYIPARILVVLGQIHKKQTPVVPVRRPQPATPSANPVPDSTSRHDQKFAQAATSPEAAAATSAGEKHEHHRPAESIAAAIPGQAPAAPASAPAPAAQLQKKHNPVPLRIFFLIVSVGLFISTITGLYMSYRYVRNKLLITVTLLAGVVIPLLLLLV